MNCLDFEIKRSEFRVTASLKDFEPTTFSKVTVFVLKPSIFV